MNNEEEESRGKLAGFFLFIYVNDFLYICKRATAYIAPELRSPPARSSL